MRTTIFSLSTLFTLSLTKISYYGVNEAGGEFGQATLPGIAGTNYAWPKKSTVDIFVDTDKINTFRLPFLLERMCPVATGLGATFDETYWKGFLDSVNYMTKTKGAYVITDPHNYMRYNDPSGQPASGSIIGNTADSKAATTAEYAAFFKEFATRLADNDKVIFSLMNEPHDMSTQLIVTNEQAAINAIRGTGATQMILAAGNGYTGGHSWTQSTGGDPSSQVMHNLKDSGNNLVFEIHEYLDADFAGANNVCSQPGSTNLKAVTAWAVSNNAKLILTEFGGGANTACYSAIDEMLTYLEQNPVWIGWTAWAAGAVWNGADACCGPNTGSLEPNILTSSGQPGGYDTIWKKAIAPHIPVGGVVTQSSSLVATTSKAAVTTSKAFSTNSKASLAMNTASSPQFDRLGTSTNFFPSSSLLSSTSPILSVLTASPATLGANFSNAPQITSSASSMESVASAVSVSTTAVAVLAPSTSDSSIETIGFKALIVVGVVVLILCCLAAWAICRRQRSKKEDSESDTDGKEVAQASVAKRNRRMESREMKREMKRLWRGDRARWRAVEKSEYLGGITSDDSSEEDETPRSSRR